MSFTYLLLLTTSGSSFFIKNRFIILSLVFLTISFAFIQGTLDLQAVLALSIFALICDLYFNRLKNYILQFIIFIIIASFGLAFFNHLVAGFFNYLVFSDYSVSESSTSFTMYLNFDKVSSTLILFIVSGLYLQEGKLTKNVVITTLVMSLICIATLIIPALYFKQINFDLKIPDILGIWTLNNFLFVCFAEEVFFRGFIQKQFKSFLYKILPIPYLHIFLSSFVFVLGVHFRDSIVYMICAFIAGIFYGFTYEKTNKILSSMIVHFSLNLMHIIFFTYPRIKI